MKVHFFDYRWRDEETVEVQATDGTRFGRKPFQKGESISFSVCDDPVMCAGCMVDGVWKPCDENRVGRAKCEICRNKEKSFVFTSFDGFNRDNFSEQDLAQIAGPHVVYLAFFDKGLYKVGVSKQDRKIMRQIEQGSLCTLYVAATEDGIYARQIETLIRKTGIKDKIRGSQKEDFLQSDCSYEEAEEILREEAKKIPEIVKDVPKLHTFILDEPEFVTWDEAYGVDKIKAKNERVHIVNLQPNDALSGTIIATKGVFIVVDTTEELVCVSMKKYTGKHLDFSKKAPGLYTDKAIQNSLF